MTENQKTKLIELAKSLIGKPYKYGARIEDAPNEFDCSSFTQYIFKQIGIELPRSGIQQAGETNGIELVPQEDFSNLEIGDLLFMRSDRGHYHDELFEGRKIYIGHVAIYIAENKIIHAKKSLGGVIEQNLLELIKDSDYKIVFVKRF